MTSYVQLRQQVADLLQFLPDKPEENIDSTLRALWFTAADDPRSAPAAGRGELPPLSARQSARLDELLALRIKGAPLSHLTGRQQFMGIEMLAGPEALVPRSETELLAAIAIGQLRRATPERMPLVVDVCTGCGNVALSIAHHIGQARVCASDLSDAAIGLARRNAQHLDLAAKVEFRTGDLLAPFETPEFVGQVDVLTCNPPYINSAKVTAMPQEISAHEPRLAFDGGSLGIAIIMRLIRAAPRFLRRDGWLMFEVGLGQGPAVAKRLKAMAEFREVVPHVDAAGAVRVVAAGG